jgi:hypothetical protein
MSFALCRKAWVVGHDRHELERDVELSPGREPRFFWENDAADG